MTGPTPILSANDDPQSLKLIEGMVGLMRSAIAPLMNAADGDLPMWQSMSVTAGSMLAGMSVGHMLVFGVLDGEQGDEEQAAKVAAQAFLAGVEQGKLEAQRAVLADGAFGRVQ